MAILARSIGTPYPISTFYLFFPLYRHQQRRATKKVFQRQAVRAHLSYGECQRYRNKRPKYLLMENVSALLSKSFCPTSRSGETSWAIGLYSSFTQILNATQFGVPKTAKEFFFYGVNGDCQYHFLHHSTTKRLKDVLEACSEKTII